MKELALRHFDVQVREPHRQRHPGFRFFDFKPKTDEAMEWAKERVFYLFGGSGDPSRACAGCEPAQAERYAAEDRQKLYRMLRLLKDDPERVVAETEGSLRLMEGFLEVMEKPSLRLYATSSLYGEMRAYEMRTAMENGNNMTGYALDQLTAPPHESKRLWISPQISPYAPYAGMIFLRPAFITERFAGQCNGREVSLEELRPDARQLAEGARKIEALGDGNEPHPENVLVQIYTDVHSHALSRIFGAVHPYVKEEETELMRAIGQKPRFMAPMDGGGGFVLALQGKTEKAIRAIDVAGFVMSALPVLHEITDFVLLGGNLLFKEGRFRFLAVER